MSTYLVYPSLLHPSRCRKLLASAVLLFTLGACSEQPAEPPVQTSTGAEAPAQQQVASAAAPAAGAQAPIAYTEYGPVRGSMDGDINVFQGIRYGADTATTRFGSPARPAPWTAPAAADSFGDSAPQAVRTGTIDLFDSWIADPAPGMSEDCLFLNVWTPSLVDDVKRPVLVWLHGGGFTSGSGSSNAYNGTRLASRGDAVVVTVNHRLNIFGYLYLDHYGEQFAGSANAGVMDMVAALTWVRDNIKDFGGDPDNVTIFGESGGGFKVSTLMAMNAAKGLFHKAVVQSGPGIELLTPDEARLGTDALVAELGLDETTIDTIRELPAGEIAAAATRVAASGGPILGRRPVVDDVHINRHPFAPDAPDQSISVPLLIGSTKSEMSLLAGARRPELFDLTWETLPDALAQAIPGIDGLAVAVGYRELHPEISPAHVYFEATTDHGVFGRGSFTLADRKSDRGGASVYQYYLAWDTPVGGDKWGAPHALDIGFVFDNVALSASMSGVGEEQQAIADMMSEAWLAFAKTGNPNHEGLPEWIPYDSETRYTMIFDNTPTVVSDPRGAERALLDRALASAPAEQQAQP